MREGLNVLQVTGAYYGYAVTLVGWLRRIGGDEYELLPGYVSAWRTGAYAANGLDVLASKGPGKKYATSGAAESAESIHRLLVRRCKPANVEAWAKTVPKPAGWVER